MEEIPSDGQDEMALRNALSKLFISVCPNFACVVANGTEVL